MSVELACGMVLVIKTYSKSKCYNPHAPEEHVPDPTESHRDVLGIVRAIAAKERSSAKRKESFCSLQKKAGSKTVLQLILDNSVVFDVCHASPWLHAKLFVLEITSKPQCGSQGVSRFPVPNVLAARRKVSKAALGTTAPRPLGLIALLHFNYNTLELKQQYLFKLNDYTFIMNAVIPKNAS
ncbi:hypothetical protein B0H13DRAFT_2520829 [Mycena leptocephala]|nr:hypothetical protein B0H13DRAFT_2520829 [Mycena leptocephala]